MYETILPIMLLSGISISKPYLKNKLGESISADQFVIYNCILMLLLLIGYYIIRSRMYNEPFVLSQCFSDWNNIQLKYKIILFFMAILAIYDAFTLFQISNKENIAKNTVSIKIVSSVGLILFGIYAYDEKLTKQQIFGILMILVGFYFIQNKQK